MNGEEYNEEYTSKYNEAALQIMRLNISWIKCGNFAQKGQLTEWKWELDKVWRELASDAAQKHTEDWHKNPINTKMTALFKLIRVNEEKRDYPAMYKWLSNTEITLRRLQNDVGKGGAYVDTQEGML